MAAASEWWFYQIEHTSLEAAIAPLLEKCLERKWRVLVVGHEETLTRLDRALWIFPEESFLPHGRLDAARQPVLLSTEAAPANGAKVALLLDGSDAEAAQFERVMVVFEGGQETARAKARQQFKAATDGGARARYFQQQRKGGWKEFVKEAPAASAEASPEV